MLILGHRLRLGDIIDRANIHIEHAVERCQVGKLLPIGVSSASRLFRIAEKLLAGDEHGAGVLVLGRERRFYPAGRLFLWLGLRWRFLFRHSFRSRFDRRRFGRSILRGLAGGSAADQAGESRRQNNRSERGSE